MFLLAGYLTGITAYAILSIYDESIFHYG